MTSSAPSARRDTALRRLASEQFDLLVIGGGITGAGVARDAALRGFKVALVEKADYGSGTSSKSSKLVHGGLRYLEHAQFRLVFEGTNERALLMRVAPHLVRPLEFVMPSYKHDKPGLFVLDVGLWIYDALSKFSSPRLHRTIRAGRLHRLEPGLADTDLQGGILYYDCMTDDARLTLENVVDAERQGAVTLNYARVTGLVREDDRIVGAEIVDQEQPGAAPIVVRAKACIGATGPWSDDVQRMKGEQPILSASKGVHIVVDAARFSVHHAVVMKEKRRVVFCIPWGDRTVIGTTDTFYEGAPEDVAADRADVEYLLQLANHYFPQAKLELGDVLATWAGLRPLLRPGADVATASDVSREHHIFSRPGMVTVAGGKLTTYRRMAAEVVDAAVEQLEPRGPCTTEERPLPGGEGLDGFAGIAALSDELHSGGVVDAAAAKHLALTYGACARQVVERVAAEPRLGERLDPELPHLLAQVDWAVAVEQARTVDDVLGRRVPLLLRARDQGLGAAARVAEEMARHLGWSEATRRAQVDAYRAVVARTRRFREGA